LKVLVDTNILSEARRPSGHQAVKRYLAEADENDLYLSVITLGEIAYGIARLDPGARRTELQNWLDQTQTLFVDRLLPIDRAIAVAWGRLTARCAAAGHTLGQADGLIAATAQHHGLIVLTRNTRDFLPTDVPAIDPTA
jgi:predicted nucleic acid-binding protein